MPDPAHLAWSCGKCKSRRPESVHWYTAWLLRLHRLRQAGVPLAEWCDLSPETWLDLGEVAEALEIVRLAWRTSRP